MKNTLSVRFVALAMLFAAAACRAWGSDHADPMSLNVLALQEEPNANITDLHAFVVNHAGEPVLDPARLAEGERLVISLCVRRALQPTQNNTLAFDGYNFRVHIDFDPKVRF